MSQESNHGSSSAPQAWLERLRPKQPTDNNSLPSFAAIKQKTLQTLYGDNGRDKSPKGSIDHPIVPLVDLINAHPSFATLSSCSGRISLFDPHGAATDCSNQPQQQDDESSTHGGGKGYGAWLLVSHEEIEDPSRLVHAVLESKNPPNSCYSFKMEPMLLHIAAATLEHGRQLLTLALGLGFRESGLVVTEHRVTVAIRTQSLALVVPLAPTGPLCPSEAYLKALLVESNARLRQNLQLLRKLQTAVAAAFFEPRDYTLSVATLPNLNLWGAAAAAIPIPETGVDIVAFGGYGPGPLQPDSGCQRSDAVYCLEQRNSTWSSSWRRVDQLYRAKQPLPTNLAAFGNLPVDSYVPFTPRQGLAACVLPPLCADSSETIVAVFGGRKGPAQPLNDLLLYHSQNENCFFSRPTDVRGTPPSPRWGHSWMALSNDNPSTTTPLALLVGGRNETSVVLDSVYVLSALCNEETAAHWLWEPLATTSVSRFHHNSLVVNNNAQDVCFVFGGLCDPTNVVEPMQQPQGGTTVTRFRVDTTKSPETNSMEILESESPQNNAWKPRMGASLCAWKNGPDTTLALISGGIALGVDNPSNEDDCACLEVMIDGRLERRQLQLDTSLEFGSMVHHCCVGIPGKTHEAVLVGGGVSTFAFGASFARSYHISVRANDAEHSQPLAVKSKTTHSSPSKAVKPNDAATEEPNVIYVKKQDAKVVKTALEELRYLDKSFRMAPATSASTGDKESPREGWIAIPVILACLQEVVRAQEQATTSPESWMSRVLGHGQQTLPRSSRWFARKKT